MDKKILDELKTTAKATFSTTKEFTKNKSVMISEKFNDKVEDGIETALKYRKYFLAYLDEKKPLEKVKKDEVLTKTIETVKSSTEKLRDKLKTNKNSVVDADESNQDDIIIDNRSAFGKAKNENPTVVFYPDGTSKIVG